MRIDWKQSLEGFSALQIRDVLREVQFIDTEFGPRLIENSIKRLSNGSGQGLKERAQRLLNGLLASNLVAMSPDTPGKYILTQNGIGLRAARATKRLKRERADRAVEALLATAEQINSDPIFLHDVASIAVFGSYLTDEPDLGDIDAAIELKARWKPHPRLISDGLTDRERGAAIFELTYPPPASFYRNEGWRFWPETYARRLLQTDFAMTLIEKSLLETIGCPYRVIFPATEEVAAKPEWSWRPEVVTLRSFASASR